MSYEPLHHKYRPQTLADLVGQDAISQTLANALTSQKIAPAYLFTGPRGTGKTSSARIFAKSLNCLNSSQPTPKPCGECEVCKSISRGSALDVIEIDAASNTGVDNIREIIERAQFAPVRCRYKVYAIDECHMLSTAAFNALLKTLEEPPDRVIFILATTDPQRVLPTIISRCQRFDYRRIPLEAMASHLSYIARQEKIDITAEAIAIISQLANGGLRDAESLLDQLSLFSETIVPAKVWDLIGAVPEDDLLTLIEAIRSDDPEAVIQRCRHILDRGKEALIVLQSLANFYLNLLIAKTSPNRSDLVAVTSATWQELIREASHWQIESILQGQKILKDSEVQLKNTTQTRLWLEITLLSLLPSANRSIVTPPLKNNSRVEGDYSSKVNDKAGSSASFATLKRQKEEIDRSIDKNANKDNSIDVSQTNNSDDRIITETAILKENDLSENSTAEKTAVEKIQIGSIEEIGNIEIDRENKTQQIVREIDKKNDPEPKENDLPKIDLDTIWQKAIAVVVPPTTKELLRQQCFPISFDGTIVKIGIGSPQLLKLHQGKLANIEAAFSRICNYKVKAIFEVAKLSQNKEKKINDRDINIPSKPQSRTTEEKTNYTLQQEPKQETNQESIVGKTNSSLTPQSPSNLVAQPSENKSIDTTPITTKIIESPITDKKVVDIQSYRKEHRETERILPQIREVNGSNLPTKQSIGEAVSTKPTSTPEKINYDPPKETEISDINLDNLELSKDNIDTSIINEELDNSGIEDDCHSLQEVKKIAEEIANIFNGEIINSD
jgi:DNA polymerase III subunit gamma/tau